MIEELKKRNQPIVIYGAGRIGAYIGSDLIENGIEIMCFAVSGSTPSGRTLLGKPVVSIDDIKDADSYFFIIAISDKNEDKRIRCKLASLGVKDYTWFDKDEIATVKSRYIKNYWQSHGFNNVDNHCVEEHFVILDRTENGKYFRFRLPLLNGLPYPDELERIHQEPGFAALFQKQYGDTHFLSSESYDLPDNLSVNSGMDFYAALCYKDRRIVDFEYPSWVKMIQAGASLTNRRVADITDDSGMNISNRNRDYSEGSALYWIWKNTSGQNYIGFFQYGRYFVSDAECMREFLDYDLITTIPTIMTKGMKPFFTEFYLLDSDWKLMGDGIRLFGEDYYQTFLKYQVSRFYFSSNVFCAKRSIFDELCTFVFSVTEYVDKVYRDRMIIREDRFMGYIIENLVSIYIMHNHSKLKKATVDMHFLKGKDA